MTINDYCQYIGSALGLIGAFLLAFNTRVSKYGWVAFFGANIAMFIFAVHVNALGLAVQQVGFVASSCLGWYRVKLWPFAGVLSSEEGMSTHD